MKKLSLFALTAAVLAACDTTPTGTTPADFDAIETEIQNVTISSGQLTMLSLGPQGDYIISLPATDALLKIASNAKNVAFLSVSDAAKYAADDICLLNIIPDNTMQMMGTPENKCNFRLFCGTADDINNNQLYAVEVCSE